MEKFSLYEILSFLLPGFVLIGIVQLYQKYVFGCEHLLFSSDSKFSESIVLLCLSLFVGIVIHVSTFLLMKQKYFKWFKNAIMQSVQEISANNKFIQCTIPFLNEEYRKLRKHDELPVNENEAENNLFDFAYYYLEVNGKISAAKNFQSLYFWFRNMFTISCFLLPVSMVITAIALYKGYTCNKTDSAILIMTINLITLFIIIPTARWLRTKYVDKVFWSYYVERLHQNEKNNKQ